jgi:hypothetical protein
VLNDFESGTDKCGCNMTDNVHLVKLFGEDEHFLYARTTFLDGGDVHLMLVDGRRAFLCMVQCQ